MPSIINGLFSGRSGISSHGMAIAVVGDNISNASTIGYKAGRTEFEDLIAGGQTAGKVVGSGSSVSAVTNIFGQGTLEFTGRDLDLAIDGNGFFIIDNNGEQCYTRAGNFKVNAAGYLVDQKGNNVLGFPEGGTGALEPINLNDVSQSNVATSNVAISGNLDASNPVNALYPADITDTTYAELGSADFMNVVKVFDSLGASHTVALYFYKTQAGNPTTTPETPERYTVLAYTDGAEVTGGTDGKPYYIGPATPITLDFDSTGARTSIGNPDMSINVQWSNGAADSAVNFNFNPFTSYSTASNINSITGDGDGVGAVSSLSIDRQGQIFAVLNNGQSSVIGTIGLANFANAEGLVRVGGNLLQETTASGAAIIGRPGSGTFGSIESGSVELSTVDIASEFVKLITLQRGFQANSRIITTINQLLNEIINLA